MYEAYPENKEHFVIKEHKKVIIEKHTGILNLFFYIVLTQIQTLVIVW